LASQTLKTKDEDTLWLPGKLEHAVNWLIATIDGECGPGKEFEVPLRHLILKGGRGSGKSHSVARILAQVGVLRSVRMLCTRETQKSIEESVMQLLDDVIHELEYESHYDIKKTTIDGANGSQFLFAGLRQQDVAKLKSTERIMLCWCEEAHVLSDKSLDVLSPTIREENSVIIYTYNPELEDDPVHARYALDPQDDVCVVTMNWSDNKWFPAVLEKERLRSYELDKTEGKTKYNWIWEGETLPAVEGAIFAAEVAKLQERGRYRPIDYDSSGRVHVVMDLGYGVMTAILVQKFASTIQIIGYRELYHSTYHDLTTNLEKLPYRWGKVFMPHDASHRDPKYGKSHFDVMEELGWKIHYESPGVSIPQIGIENYVAAGRDMFQNTYIANNPDPSGETCEQLMRCLRRWRYQVVDTNTGSTKTMPPMKDQFGHGGEAFCYTAVVADMLVNETAPITNPYKGFQGGYAA
jgi:phage terminase large subunit